MMRQRNRLSALQMRIAGHHGFDVTARDTDRRSAKRTHEPDDLRNLVAQVEP